MDKFKNGRSINFSVYSQINGMTKIFLTLVDGKEVNFNQILFIQ